MFNAERLAAEEEANISADETVFADETIESET